MFQLSRSQKEIQKAAQEFAKGEFDKEMTVTFEKDHAYPEDIWRKAADLGFIGIEFPEDYSGGGMGLMEGCLIAEALCRKDSTMGSALMTAAIGAACVHRFGDDALKSKVLPEVAEGRALCAAAFAETDHADDFAVIETTAHLDDNEWVVNGVKRHVINGGAAAFYVVLARSGPDAGDTVMLLVEGEREGIRAASMGDKLAFNMVATAEVSFDNVRVPQSHLIGKPGKGIPQALKFLDEVKLYTAGQAVGIAQGAFDRALLYVKQREQFNRKLAQFQVVRHKIAEMAAKVESARMVTYHAATVFDTGKPDAGLCAMAKLTATRLAVEVADEAIQLFGGYGYMTEQEVERCYRDAKALAITLGNTDSQKNLIADMLIGKLK